MIYSYNLLLLECGIEINVSDSTSISDVATVTNTTVPLDASDASVVSEDIKINIDFNISVIDNTNITEAAYVAPDYLISTYSEVLVNEYVYIDLYCIINSFDEVVVSEYTVNITSDCILYTTDIVAVVEYINNDIQQFGAVVWGHDTGVEEPVVRNFQGNWTGTGSIGGSGDEEVLEMDTGTYMESENIQLGTGNVVIAINKYRSGTYFPVRKYKTAGIEGDLAGASWNSYTDQFYSEGWVKIRLEAA